MYVAVKGGEKAIRNAHKLFAAKRRGDANVPGLGLDQIVEQLSFAVDRVMGEGSLFDRELAALREMSAYAHSLGLEVHAGHGLTYDTVQPVAAFPEVMELNIGHFIIGEAIFRGLQPAIAEMRRLMDEARGTEARSAG